jgi:hypothetical protein
MSRVFVWAAAICVTGSIALAHGLEQQRPVQQPESTAPPERGVLKTHQYDVVVSGCVKGKRLERAFIHSAGDLPFDALRAASFALDGPKELLRQIADEHKNHFDQVIGIATVPPSMSRAQSEVKSKRIGPISIGIGGRQETSPLQSAPQTVKLRVSSFVHVQDGCASR